MIEVIFGLQAGLPGGNKKNGAATLSDLFTWYICIYYYSSQHISNANLIEPSSCE